MPTRYRANLVMTACLLTLPGLLAPSSVRASGLGQDLGAVSGMALQGEAVLIDARNGRVLDIRLHQSLAEQLTALDKAEAGERLRAELQAQEQAITPRPGPWPVEDEAVAAIPVYSIDGHKVGELEPAGSEATDPLIIRQTDPDESRLSIPVAEARYCSDAHAIVLHALRDELADVTGR